MASFLRCQNCGHETETSSGLGLAAFDENPHCTQCGLSATEGDNKMQDQLVAMMSQHMHLNSIQAAPSNASMPPTPQVSPHPAPIAYITQHYHHSGHQVSGEGQVSSVLDAAGVNASLLLPSQLTLFKNADDEQRQRLIELWKIAPPQPGNQLAEMGNWPQTSMEMEEAAAKTRWEEAERERLKVLCVLPGYENKGSNAEPYMTSLYDQLPANGVTASPRDSNDYRPCKDPVYNRDSREWWHMSDQEPVEHQYGLLQAMMYGNGIEYYQPAPSEDEEML